MRMMMLCECVGACMAESRGREGMLLQLRCLHSRPSIAAVVASRAAAPIPTQRNLLLSTASALLLPSATIFLAAAAPPVALPATAFALSCSPAPLLLLSLSLSRCCGCCSPAELSRRRQRVRDDDESLLRRPESNARCIDPLPPPPVRHLISRDPAPSSSSPCVLSLSPSSRTPVLRRSSCSLSLTRAPPHEPLKSWRSSSSSLLSLLSCSESLSHGIHVPLLGIKMISLSLSCASTSSTSPLVLMLIM